MNFSIKKNIVYDLMLLLGLSVVPLICIGGLIGVVEISGFRTPAICGGLVSGLMALLILARMLSGSTLVEFKDDWIFFMWVFSALMKFVFLVHQ